MKREIKYRIMESRRNMKRLFFIIHQLTKGGNTMIMAYCVLIIEDETFTFEMVPKRYKAKVKEKLAKMGLDENGDPIA